MKTKGNKMLDKDLEDDRDYFDNCQQCEKLEDKIVDAGELIKDALKNLYGEEDFDLAAFEDSMDELCGLLGVRFNMGSMNTQVKCQKPVGWISIEDREHYPKDGQTVLVFADDFVREAMLDEGKWCSPSYSNIRNASHFMFLPEPPTTKV